MPADPTAVVADDYPGMKPRMHVQVGDHVKRGQLLFEDRKTDGVRFTSPGAGTVAAINRGARRALQSVVIELTASERRGKPENSDCQPFDSFTGRDVAELDTQAVLDLLVESGLWTAIRQRPSVMLLRRRRHRWRPMHRWPTIPPQRRSRPLPMQHRQPRLRPPTGPPNRIRQWHSVLSQRRNHSMPSLPSNPKRQR